MAPVATSRPDDFLTVSDLIENGQFQVAGGSCLPVVCQACP